jgi:hypothetical protein
MAEGVNELAWRIPLSSMLVSLDDCVKEDSGSDVARSSWLCDNCGTCNNSYCIHSPLHNTHTYIHGNTGYVENVIGYYSNVIIILTVALIMLGFLSTCELLKLMCFLLFSIH